ncbi:GNAT family N-acetyltransferase [Pseudomonas sp. MWU15-20650]|uniref:GNAT family N-acetyltransferase n=1 Tax=Pseudomonas sp. MWU15-20650 TaxID=2933107 RepID=UPI00200BF402|nr:GNAT family N-acetyltransferase [Pseudomonas sp. MWU15-20650]
MGVEQTGRIRLARADDAALLPGIERSAAQAFRRIVELSWLADAAPISFDLYRQWIALSTSWVVVDTHAQPQGFLTAERVGDDLHLHELSVALPLQGQGWGRKLVETAMAYARAHHLQAVTLTTFEHVPWNAPFYRRLGFEAYQDPRLAQILAREYAQGFAPGSRCAMAWHPGLCPNPS